jgi:hypothetical protein
MTTPTLNWPKSYLLQCHADAIKHGMIFVEPITEAEARSFTQRFYRMRRRSDKSMASLIPPEYHLVSVGEWEPFGITHPEVQPPRGRLPIIFSSLPSGEALPNLRPATETELTAALTPQQPLLPLETLIDLDAIEQPMAPGELEDFVSRMASKVEKSDDD